MRLARHAVTFLAAFSIAIQPGLVSAQTLPPEPTYAAFEAAKLREAQMRAAYRRSVDDRAGAEARATAQREREFRLRQQQVAQLAEIERAAIAALDRLLAVRGGTHALRAELTILEDWYETLQPAIANLTERSFRPVERELEVLAASGLIAPGVRRITSYLQLRQNIMDVRRRLGEKNAQADAEAAKIRTEVAAAKGRRDRLLQTVTRPTAADGTAVERWLTATADAARAGAQLAEAENQVLATYEGAMEAAGRLRPTVLIDVSADVGGSRVYQAQWLRPDGSKPDERQREAARRQLRQRQSALDDMSSEIRAARAVSAAERLELAERMTNHSRVLEASAQRYRSDLFNLAVAAVAVDVALTTVEIVLTGGTATLLRKADQIATEAASRARVTKGILDNASSALSAREREVLRIVTEGTILDPPIPQLQRAAAEAARQLADSSAAYENALRLTGTDPARAAVYAKRMYDDAGARLAQIVRYAPIAEAAAKEASELKTQAGVLGINIKFLQLPGGLGSPAASTAWLESLAPRLPGAVPTIPAIGRGLVGGGNAGEPFPGVLPVSDTYSDTLFGEGLEFGITTLMNAYKERPAQAGAESLTRWGRITAAARGTASIRGYLSGNIKNGWSLAVGAASSAYQIQLAKLSDQRINAEADFFARNLNELTVEYEFYYRALQVDQVTHAFLRKVVEESAGVDAALLALNSGYELRRPAPAQTKTPTGTLTLRLAFSAPLTAAPQARLGLRAIALRPSGTGGLQWEGSVPAGELGTGQHQLAVTLPAGASAYGNLDSDPASAALRPPGASGWTGFEAGPDTNHVIAMNLDDAPVPPAPTPRAVTAASPVPSRGAIWVVAATYGGNCRQPRGNVTQHLANACNGKASCEYTVDYMVIGDPAQYCPKDYVAEWTCTGAGGGTVRAGGEAGFGTKVMLACGAPR